MNYNKYIQSDKWKSVRKRYYSSKLIKKCYICESIKNLNLHHKSYKTLGKENLNHLLPLCKKHHYLVHQYLNSAKKYGYTRVNIWNVVKKYYKRIKKGLKPNFSIRFKNPTEATAPLGYPQY